MFHNPGTVNCLVGLRFRVALDGDGNPVNVYVTNNFDETNREGAFLVYADGGTLTVEGECQQQWHAVSFSGFPAEGCPLTIMDSNI